MYKKEMIVVKMNDIKEEAKISKKNHTRMLAFFYYIQCMYPGSYKYYKKRN